MSQRNRRTVYSTDPAPTPPAERPSQSSPGNPAAPYARQGNRPVRVGIERKGRRGKTVSVISGVLSPPAGKEALLKLLKSKLGAGGAVKVDTIEIQGDHRDRIVPILTELGYKAKASGG